MFYDITNLRVKKNINLLRNIKMKHFFLIE